MKLAYGGESKLKLMPLSCASVKLFLTISCKQSFESNDFECILLLAVQNTVS